MFSDRSVTRRRLEIQGFIGLNDKAITTYGPWLRLAYALCTTLAIIGVVKAQTTILWILFPIAVLGAILPFHPFDLIYNLGIRRITGTGPLPRRGAPSRFACGLGAVLVFSTVVAFETGHMVTGYIVGGAVIFSGTLVSTTDICIPSLIYRIIFGFQPKTEGRISDVTEIPARKQEAL